MKKSKIILVLIFIISIFVTSSCEYNKSDDYSEENDGFFPSFSLEFSSEIQSGDIPTAITSDQTITTSAVLETPEISAFETTVKTISAAAKEDEDFVDWSFLPLPEIAERAFTKDELSIYKTIRNYVLNGKSLYYHTFDNEVDDKYIHTLSKKLSNMLYYQDPYSYSFERLSIKQSNNNEYLFQITQDFESKMRNGDAIFYLYEKYKDVSKNWTNKTTDIDKARDIATYICNTTTFDEEKPQADTIESYKDGYAVCQGYSMVFQVFADLAELNASLYQADNLTPDEQGHAWTLIEIDGKWYMIDLLRMDNHDKEIKYEWFLASDTKHTKYNLNNNIERFGYEQLRTETEGYYD
jgi:hypothetical protein